MQIHGTVQTITEILMQTPFKNKITYPLLEALSNQFCKGSRSLHQSAPQVAPRLFDKATIKTIVLLVSKMYCTQSNVSRQNCTSKKL